MGFFVRESKRHNFRLVQETWSPRKTVTVPRELYGQLGFRHDFTLEEAKERAAQLNLQENLDNKKAVAAARRVELKKSVSSAFLPPKNIKSFEDEIKETYNDNKMRLKTITQHWQTAQILISDLEIDPKYFFAERIKIFNYYKSKQWSPDYIKRITRILNLWGGHYCRQNNLFFQPLPKLSTHQSQKLVDLRELKSDIRKPAMPLEWQDLKNLKTKFEANDLLQKWNWLFIGLWFGLRPSEIDNLKNDSSWKIEFDKQHKLNVLSVYQTKLTNLPKASRWKSQPILFQEQIDAAELIKSGAFDRPLNKTLESYFQKKIETYSPRKGFTDLMLEKGYALEDISVFLGHADISMTWKHYKSKAKYKLPMAS